MAIRYVCRGCHQTLAEFQDHTNELSYSLGLLTPEERMHMLKEDDEGNIYVQILCEYCQEAISEHPELSLLPSPLQ